MNCNTCLPYVDLQLADDEMVQHEADSARHLELLTEHISLLELENSRLKGRIEVLTCLNCHCTFWTKFYKCQS